MASEQAIVTPAAEQGVLRAKPSVGELKCSARVIVETTNQAVIARI